MSNSVLTKYREITPVNNEDVTNGLLKILVEMDADQQMPFWTRSSTSGSVCIFKNDAFPEYTIEYVQGVEDDSVTTLYRNTRLLADRDIAVAVRDDLIDEIGRVLLALPSTVAVQDSGRDRQAMLKELGTAQLMDVLAHFTHTDIATI